VIREEIDRLLSRGLDHEANLLSELAELGLRYLVQQGLEQEQADALGGVTTNGAPRANGSAAIATATRTLVSRPRRKRWRVKVPQVRGSESPYRSSLMEFLDGNSDVLERLVVAPGRSTVGQAHLGLLSRLPVRITVVPFVVGDPALVKSARPNREDVKVRTTPMGVSNPLSVRRPMMATCHASYYW
jgi:hypothetical protein